MQLRIKNKILFLLFFTFSLFHFLTFLYSAPHISGKYHKGEPRVKPRQLPDVFYLRAKGAPRKDIAKALGTVGTKKVAVIIVDFPDQGFTTDLKEANTTFNKLKEYYDEVSYGQLQLDITFFYQGGFTKTLNGTEVAYTMPDIVFSYAQNTEESLSQLVRDAIYTAGIYSSNYDCVMVLHAGYGEESRPPTQSIWSVYVHWNGAVNGFTDGTIVPEKEYGNASPLGVVCHEFGHQLGLPDLYYIDYENDRQYSRIGDWCLMDHGCWLGNPYGSQPAHLSIWCKDFLGWIDLQIVSSTTRNIQLPYIEASSSAIKIEILTADDPKKEYFLLEYRRKILFDSSLPGEGLLIWRIDDNIAKNPIRLYYNNVNSGEPHFGVDLIEADKTIISNNNTGDSGDPFPGSKNVVNFLPSDYNLTTFNGDIIPIYITDISHNGNYANFNILYKLEMENLVQGEVRIGNNYTYAGRVMTIGFNLIEASNLEILVYNLSGKVVKNFGEVYYPSGEHTVQMRAVDDNNENLPPGLYFLVVKGKNIHKVEKFIIRK